MLAHGHGSKHKQWYSSRREVGLVLSKSLWSRLLAKRVNFVCLKYISFTVITVYRQATLSWQWPDFVFSSLTFPVIFIIKALENRSRLGSPRICWSLVPCTTIFYNDILWADSKSAQSTSCFEVSTQNQPWAASCTRQGSQGQCQLSPFWPTVPFRLLTFTPLNPALRDGLKITLHAQLKEFAFRLICNWGGSGFKYLKEK